MRIINLCLFISLLFMVGCQEEVEVEKEKETIVINKTEDYLAIEKVIQNYFDGWLTGDAALVGSAMHSSCHLKFIRDGKVEVRDKTAYLSGFKPRPRLENAGGKILSIDITGTAAEAKIELDIPTRLFTDYFNLLKEGDRWYITDKVSVNVLKEEKKQEVQ